MGFDNPIDPFIDNVETSTSAEEEQRDVIKGQAYAIRALAHFDLCRQFGKAYSHDNGASLGVPVVAEVLNPDEKFAVSFFESIIF